MSDENYKINKEAHKSHKEFVYDTERKLIRVVKQHLGEKVTAEETAD